MARRGRTHEEAFAASPASHRRFARVRKTLLVKNVKVSLERSRRI